MDVYEFLKQLNCFFPNQEKEEMFTIRVSKYSELLNNIEKNTNKKLDYDSMLNLLVENYPYKAFPNYTEITKHIVYLPSKENEKTEKEWVYRKYIVRTEDGREYEFVTVPNSWEGVHTLSEFDNYEEIIPPPDDEEEEKKNIIGTFPRPNSHIGGDL